MICMKKYLSFYFSLFITLMAFSQDSTVIKLWPKVVPGQSEPQEESRIIKDTLNEIDWIKKVTEPTITVFKPKSKLSKSTGILIAPGGAYQGLAITHEGFEVAHWLNRLGYTAFILQYRVPDQRDGALQDAQRALRLIRANAEKWGISPQKIGILGFSAGGHLSARISTNYKSNLYPRQDSMDYISARPNFTILIYPAYLDEGKNHTLSPELTMDPENTPPFFIFQTADDPYGHSSLVMAAELRKHKIPVELHLYPKGGHGYGLRKNTEAGRIWPELLTVWLDTITAQ